MSKMNKKPEIRFTGFTDKWEKHKFQELVQTRRGLTYRPSDVTPNGIRVLRSSNIEDGELVLKEDDVFVNKEAINIDYVKDNDILITSANGSSRLVGKHAIINEIGENKAVHGGFMLLATAKNPNFINASMNSSWYRNFIDLYAAGGNGAIGNLNKSDLDKQEVLVPSEEEQEKIGIFFRKLDNFITINQSKCDKLVEIKKAMLEKMFPKNGQKVPEIRFKGGTDDWKECKLSDFGNSTGGTSIESEFTTDGKYKVISIGSYSEQSTYNEQGIRCKETEKTKKRILNKGDLTMVLNDKTATGRIIGRTLLIDKNNTYVFNQRTERIEPYHDKYDSTFLYQMLNAPLIRDKIYKQSQGNTQIYVNWLNIQETEYLIPDILEQKKIGIFFKQIDNVITLQQEKIEKLKNIKKACLNKMFI